jgi:hypothetical protein
MKKILFIGGLALFAAGCNNQVSSESARGDSTSASSDSSSTIQYAYMPRNHQPDNWDRGDQKNVAMVLSCLKAFENKNVDEAVKAFGDSVEWAFDNFDAKISNDSLRAMFNGFWKNMANLRIDMDDYESVISKDKKNEWVSLWYKQVVTDNKGKTDSIFVMDDLKIENGKITVLDEKSRRFPAPKK